MGVSSKKKPGTDSASDAMEENRVYHAWKREPDLNPAALKKWRRKHLVPAGTVHTIGARNPYALAERIQASQGKKKPKWHDPGKNSGWKKNRTLLSKILGIPYEQLFDPSLVPGNPLFPPSLYPVISMKSLEKSYVAGETSGESDPGNARRSKRPLLQRSAPNRVLTVRPGVHKDTRAETSSSAIDDDTSVKAKATPPGSVAGDHWGNYKKPDGTNAYYCLFQTGKLPDIIWDVIQGYTWDCYFMAALASRAWCKYPNDFPLSTNRSDPSIMDSYTLRYYYADGSGYRDVLIGSEVVLDTGNYPVFAQPSKKYPNRLSINYELWPAIYEKAYGVFMTLAAETKLPYRGLQCNIDFPRPDLATDDGGNPLTSLTHLTGLSTTDTSYLTAGNIGKCFGLIKPALKFNGTSAKTIYPTVAFTYETETEANAGYPDNDLIHYKEETLVANHSYSILGTITDPNDAAKNYIVLRNPYGLLWGADPNHEEINAYLFTAGRWTPTANDFSFSFNLFPDGIFALRADRFERYFKQFGWVKA
jgi:hypothetical protein